MSQWLGLDDSYFFMVPTPRYKTKEWARAGEVHLRQVTSNGPAEWYAYTINHSIFDGVKLLGKFASVNDAQNAVEAAWEALGREID